MTERQMWVEKYRPKTLEDLVGSPKNVKELIAFGNTFYRKIPSQKAILLSGAPGTGKTSAAYSLANDFDWEVMEVNASDSRTYDELISVIGPLLKSSSIKSKFTKRLILIDEVDSLYNANSRKDTSAERALLKIIAASSHPIVLTCNDSFKVPRKITEEVIEIKFQKIREPTIRKILVQTAKKEKYSPNIEDINQLIEKGDLRASITNLQVFLQSGQLIKTNSDLNISSFETVDRILKASDPKSVENILSKSDLTPDNAILWLEENLFRRASGIELYNGYQALIEADKYLYKARLTQDYSSWKFASKLLSFNLAATQKNTDKPGFIKTEYPTFIRKLSATKQTRKNLKTLYSKTGKMFHCSYQVFIKDVFPLLQTLAINDLAWLTRLSVETQLKEYELATILDTNIHDPRIKKILNATLTIDSDMKDKIARMESKAKPLMSFFKTA